MHCPVRLAIAILAWVLASDAASAQYFGQNKVQYKTFDFRILRTEHFDVYFYETEAAGTQLAARMAERWHARLGRLLRHELDGRQPLILYASPSDFQQTNVISGPLGEGTGGVTESLRRRIVLPLAGPLADTDHVIGHELVHAFQYDMAGLSGPGTGQGSGLGALPLWFIEGMAEYLSIGARSPLTAMWMRDAVRQEELPDIRDLDDPRYFPYRWGHALWAYIGGRWGDDAVGRVLDTGIAAGDPDVAFQTVLDLDSQQLSAAWHEALRAAYAPLERTTTPASSYGRPFTGEQALGNELNVSPSLSPDGRRLAFLSERSLFSVDLYIADVETGKTLRRLTRTAVDPHIESLQFISSAGAWDPSSRELAVTTIVAGRPVLTIYDVANEGRTREIPLAPLDGALNPSWSPDGRRIAFIGISGGLTDLFMVDVGSGAVTRLTDDAFTDLQPAWSPDGQRLALSTDRFTTSLDTLQTGALRLAIFDVGTRAARPLAEGLPGKQIGAQWSADGTHVYFVSDTGGISNLYRVGADGGGAARLTTLMTGISGITETSPALSAAAGRLAFSAFENGGYRIYLVDDVRTLVPQPDAPAATDASLLPPATAKRRVTSLIGDPTIGLTAPFDLAAAEPYRPRLQLDYAAQPTFSVGADRFGTFGGGGMAFLFSDQLGDHHLATAFQATSTFDADFGVNDLGGGLLYLNQRHRWNWGVSADQTPYRTGYFSESLGEVEGRPALMQQALVSRQTDRGVNGLLSYPLSRAQRVEVSGGFRQLHFEDHLRTVAFSLDNGEVLLDERRDLSDFPTLNLVQTSAALVYDTASFGATSPVLGQRYRAEVSPMSGSLRYTGLLADYRRYFMPARLYTIATRIMHYGRYGGDSDDRRLFPLFIGYPSLVRGYDVGTFEADECPPSPDNVCAAFDRLIGSRVLVANLELRFPLLRPFGLTRGVYGPVPVEVALFADGGVAWSRGQSPDIFGGTRKGVSSAGAAFRVNAFGIAVLQFSLARPLQRPRQGWIFQFSMSPGF